MKRSLEGKFQLTDEVVFSFEKETQQLVKSLGPILDMSDFAPQGRNFYTFNYVWRREFLLISETWKEGKAYIHHDRTLFPRGA